MVQKAYSDGIIERAKELYEGGKTYKEIQEELGIKRLNTIGEWKTKYKWKRVMDFGDAKDQIIIWDEIAQNARTYLRGKGFTSMKDALSVYEHAVKNIEALKKKGDKTNSKKDLFSLLDEDEELLEDEIESDEEKIESEETTEENMDYED